LILIAVIISAIAFILVLPQEQGLNSRGEIVIG
jgi:hypothetical protein